uniref:Uncharacterized protein n=1 Tax=Kalanchoe fedtschenkoi TaxID=63787 RepID=A0A7N0UKS3_KALFE
MGWCALMRRWIRRNVWLGFPKAQGLLVGGNHTSSRFCTR